MHSTLVDLTQHLLQRLDCIRTQLGMDRESVATAETRFSDILDSMGMSEFLATLADDFGVPPTQIEEYANRSFGSVAELAHAMHRRGVSLQLCTSGADVEAATHIEDRAAWLGGVSVRLPRGTQAASDLNPLIHRPSGWLEMHAGIQSRRVWMDEEPVQAAADAAREALANSGLLPEEVGALLVTSEAPPMLAGLAAELHHRLELRPQAVALDVGGACTGFVAALWLGRELLSRAGNVLIVAVEAPSRYLTVQPGSAGEAAALFGDGAAAAILCQERFADGVPLLDVQLQCEGSLGHLLRVEHSNAGVVELHMKGERLALRAVRTMADSVRELTARHRFSLAALSRVIVHGGNGRMPGMVARQLGIALEQVCSLTAETGNLGSVSLPAAWTQDAVREPGLVAWVAVGAGLVSASALTGGAK